MEIRKFNLDDFYDLIEKFEPFENHNLLNVNIKSLIMALKIMSESINDWPTYNLDRLDDYMIELKQLLKSEINYYTLKKCLSENWTKYGAWKVESMAVLFQIYKYYDHKFTFEEILTLIEKDIDIAFKELKID